MAWLGGLHPLGQQHLLRYTSCEKLHDDPRVRKAKERLDRSTNRWHFHPRSTTHANDEVPSVSGGRRAVMRRAVMSSRPW